jgi:hypothetical protein
MAITKEDIKDSLNPFKPSQYIKARFKLIPYVLAVALIGALVYTIIDIFVH